MKHISSKNINPNTIDKYFHEFTSNIPFQHLVIDNLLIEESANKILNNNFKLNKHWINYSFINNYKKSGLVDTKYMDETCNELLEELASKEFMNQLSKITGINNILFDPGLDGGGLHQTFNGGSLNVHTDFLAHKFKKKWKRVINLIIFLNKNWHDEYNGQLELWDEKVKNKIKAVSPIFNRCIIFKTDKKSFHGHPIKLNVPQDISRKSLSVYYYIEENKNLSLYPTLYKNRPEDSYYSKFLVKFDMFFSNIFGFLKRYHILNDKFATKVLNFFNRHK